MLKVKICGITRVEDALAAANAGAWAVGFVFVPGSPRQTAPRTAAAVSERLARRNVLSVGVFMDQPEEDVLRIAREAEVDLIQLHGAEPPEFAKAFGPSRIIRAFSPEKEEEALSHPAGYLLADRRRTAQAPMVETADLEFAARLARARGKVLLSGGLRAETVADAAARVRPWGVDVSSALESAPGVKDEELILAFLAAARRVGELA